MEALFELEEPPPMVPVPGDGALSDDEVEDPSDDGSPPVVPPVAPAPGDGALSDDDEVDGGEVEDPDISPEEGGDAEDDAEDMGLPMAASGLPGLVIEEGPPVEPYHSLYLSSHGSTSKKSLISKIIECTPGEMIAGDEQTSRQLNLIGASMSATRLEGKDGWNVPVSLGTLTLTTDGEATTLDIHYKIRGKQGVSVDAGDDTPSNKLSNTTVFGQEDYKDYLIFSVNNTGIYQVQVVLPDGEQTVAYTRDPSGVVTISMDIPMIQYQYEEDDFRTGIRKMAGGGHGNRLHFEDIQEVYKVDQQVFILDDDSDTDGMRIPLSGGVFTVVRQDELVVAIRSGDRVYTIDSNKIHPISFKMNPSSRGRRFIRSKVPPLSGRSLTDIDFDGAVTLSTISKLRYVRGLESTSDDPVCIAIGRAEGDSNDYNYLCSKRDILPKLYPGPMEKPNADYVGDMLGYPNRSLLHLLLDGSIHKAKDDWYPSSYMADAVDLDEDLSSDSDSDAGDPQPGMTTGDVKAYLGRLEGLTGRYMPLPALELKPGFNKLDVYASHCLNMNPDWDATSSSRGVGAAQSTPLIDKFSEWFQIFKGELLEAAIEEVAYTLHKIQEESIKPAPDASVISSWEEKREIMRKQVQALTEAIKGGGALVTTHVGAAAREAKVAVAEQRRRQRETLLMQRKHIDAEVARVAALEAAREKALHRLDPDRVAARQMEKRDRSEAAAAAAVESPKLVRQRTNVGE